MTQAEIDAILKKLKPEIAKAFQDAISKITSAVQLQTIVGHLKTGNIEAVILALRLDPTFFDPIDRAIANAFWQGGTSTLLRLPALPDPFPVAAWFWVLMAAHQLQSNGFENTPEL